MSRSNSFEDGRLVFVTEVEGYHFGFNSGDLYTGHHLIVKPQVSDPDKCLKCNVWFKPGQLVHMVYDVWPADIMENGWDMFQKQSGFVCQECYKEAEDKKVFFKGKLNGWYDKTLVR